MKKTPLKWGICYQGKIYVSLYGKKKAYDLLYKLSMSMNGLSVVPVRPKSQRKKLDRNASAQQGPSSFAE